MHPPIPTNWIASPGHSDDSISLLLDSGAAFIGDLPSPAAVGEGLRTESPPRRGVQGSQLAQVSSSWKRLIAHGAQLFYHSHTAPIPLAAIQGLLLE